MQLRPAPKWGPGGTRTVPTAETLRRAWPLARRLGVTRLADITGLDRLGIPTYSAVVPKSRDVLSVYNGKGSCRLDAQAGALMEAIERQGALRAENPVIRRSFRELSAHEATLNPRRVNWPLAADYDETTSYCWLEGYDLLADRPVWVPAALAGYLCGDRWGPPVFTCTSSHGLASGNTLEEAVFQALCELIERDTWTLAELRAHWVPLTRREAFLGREFATGPDDFECWPCLDLSAASPSLRRLGRAFEKAGLRPVIRDLTCGIGVTTILAAVADESVAGAPQAHLGLGTHLDARIAVARALTELAQSRAVDIQAVREDLTGAEEPGSGPFPVHTRRVTEVNRLSWFHSPSQRRRPFSEVATVEFRDVLEDLQCVFGKLRVAGLNEVIVVDLSPPDTELFVVRVILPGGETWAADRAHLGARATDWWRRHV